MLSKKLVYKASLKNKKVLITCGPTWVPIDGMRVISNQSTGELGQTMARGLQKAGAKVTLLEGPVHHRLSNTAIRTIAYFFYDDFWKLLKRELKQKYHIVIHAAAVSDYKIKNAAKTKIRSDLPKLKLNLVPTQKIINRIKKCRPECFLVGFKLESDLNPKLLRQKTEKLFKEAKCDLVVANTQKQKKYNGYIVDKTSNVLARAARRTDLSKNLIKILKERL